MIPVLTQPNNLVGELKKTFQADAPDHTKIPVKDLLGATVVLISCSYHGQEFIRVGLVNLNSCFTDVYAPGGLFCAQ